MGFLQNTIKRIFGFLRRGTDDAKATEIPKRNGQKSPAVEISRAPGLTCPECGYRIQVSIPMLISGQPLVCTGCSLVLHVEQDRSAAALNALKQLNVSLNQAQQKQQEAVNFGRK
jgi:hypothetical protein